MCTVKPVAREPKSTVPKSSNVALYCRTLSDGGSTPFAMPDVNKRLGSGGFRFPLKFRFCYVVSRLSHREIAPSQFFYFLVFYVAYFNLFLYCLNKAALHILPLKRFRAGNNWKP